MLIDFTGSVSVDINAHPNQFAVRFETSPVQPETGLFLEHVTGGEDGRVCRGERQTPVEREEYLSDALETHIIPPALNFGGTYYRLTGCHNMGVYMRATETIEIIARRHDNCASYTLQLPGMNRALVFSLNLPAK